MWFRFKLVEGDSATFTQWQQEQMAYSESATTTVAMRQLRAVNPDAAISIERSNTKPDESNGG